MNKRKRLVVVGATGLLLLLSGSLCAYYLRDRATAVAGYERGSPALPQHVLIAAQGSDFKDRLVAALVERLERRPAYVKVIDVAALDGIDAASWQAIVIVHTWEFGRPPRAISDFTARQRDPGGIIAVTTSGSGREKPPGVDVVSSASVVDELPALVEEVATKIEARLAAG